MTATAESTTGTRQSKAVADPGHGNTFNDHLVTAHWRPEPAGRTPPSVR